MQIFGSINKAEWNKRRSAITNKIASSFSSAGQSGVRGKLAVGSVALLAFLIAPLAALVWAGGSTSGNGVNLISPSSSASDAQGQNNVNDHRGSISSESITSSNGSSVKGGNSSASVSVDGQDIAVPDSGSVNKTVTTSDGQTTHVSVTNNTSSSSSGNSQSTNSHLRVRSHSTTNVFTDSSP